MVAAGLRRYGIVVAVCVLALALALGSDHFLTLINLRNTVEAGAIYGIVAIGLTVLLITGEFDLSAGATCVLAGIVAAKLQPLAGTWPALGLGVCAGAAVGVFNGTAVQAFGINSFVATLASSLIAVGIGTAITNGFQLYIADPGFGVLGNGRILGINIFVLIFLGFAVASGFVLSQTPFGPWIYATGDNAEAARRSGVNIGAMRFGTFVFSGFAAGVAGVILVSRTGTAIAGAGLADILFPAIAAVVVGGTSIKGGRGAIWRTVLGVLFLELIRNGFNLFEVNPYYQSICQGLIILVAVGADPLARRSA